MPRGFAIGDTDTGPRGCYVQCLESREYILETPAYVVMKPLCLHQIRGVDLGLHDHCSDPVSECPEGTVVAQPGGVADQADFGNALLAFVWETLLTVIPVRPGRPRDVTRGVGTSRNAYKECVPGGTE